MVAAEAVGSFIADGAGGGQYARTLAQGKVSASGTAVARATKP